MEGIIKKYQQKFRKAKEEMGRWDELQSRLLSQFSSASAIIQRLQVLQNSKNYGALTCVQGIEDSVLAKQMESLQVILLGMNKTLEDFCGVCTTLEKMARDGAQLIKGGSSISSAKQQQQGVGIKPSVAVCLDGLRLLSEMHRSEYHLKVSVVAALGKVALNLCCFYTEILLVSLLCLRSEYAGIAVILMI
ncbi:OLC1v1017685C7 [Oldenlandia corymbosa var. corymbosa]|uniref:OLC1v1017685C7 n=1 Tax=Oldenlandia corymbosa var. corymbosa TaxID=529605 RepID=A0AAV1EA56_OLDCO|nr:OLC1v1017685C7 [Oldenlandia corymbosa var. corymbosa]